MKAAWHENAIIYGIDVGRFADSNDDGIGDLRGVIERLDYLKELGVTCLWLLPCFATADRDNGYDVIDYYRIDPRHGTFEDFLELVHRAGERGMRVLLDLVVNHTSSEHPWFQAARHDPGSCFRDYYVWSEGAPSIAPDEISIFPGEESSVWTYDEVARAYYYHRFYRFQPELNIANPEVRAEIRRIVDYWLSFGVAGFRLDAAPVMIWRKGVDGPRPDDPHGVLRELHEFVRARRADGVLLGEVNVEPDKVGQFFGQTGDELNMLFNFGLTAHIFLALARRRGDVLARAMRRLPRPPAGCQWANFLRNLDDLDLSKLTEEERQDVYAAFAPKKEMQIYGRGIRRRLAPMLDNRRHLELALSLLASLPGAPTLIYGDEVAMGEDLSRPWRESVRLPMDWRAVAAQQQDEDSVLGFVRRLIDLRRRLPDIGQTDWELVETGQATVFAHRFHLTRGALIMLHNFADKACTVEFDSGGSGDFALDGMLGEGARAENGRVRMKLAGFDRRWLSFEHA